MKKSLIALASKEEDAESKTRKEPKKQWKRQEKKDNSIKKQNTSKADKKQTDGTGDESVPGGKDGGSGVPDLPDQQVTEGDGGQQPEETVDDAKATQTPKPSVVTKSVIIRIIIFLSVVFQQLLTFRRICKKRNFAGFFPARLYFDRKHRL